MRDGEGAIRSDRNAQRGFGVGSSRGLDSERRGESIPCAARLATSRGAFGEGSEAIFGVGKRARSRRAALRRCEHSSGEGGAGVDRPERSAGLALSATACGALRPASAGSKHGLRRSCRAGPVARSAPPAPGRGWGRGGLVLRPLLRAGRRRGAAPALGAGPGLAPLPQRPGPRPAALRTPSRAPEGAGGRRERR